MADSAKSNSGKSGSGKTGTKSGGSSGSQPGSAGKPSGASSGTTSSPDKRLSGSGGTTGFPQAKYSTRTSEPSRGPVYIPQGRTVPAQTNPNIAIPASVQGALADTPIVTVEVERNPLSMSTVGMQNTANLGLDKVSLINHRTGEVQTFTMQTVSNDTDGATGTIAPGPIAITRAAPGTNMPEPENVMTITRGRTIGGGVLKDDGCAYYSSGKESLPYRVHRDIADAANPSPANKPTGAGCFTDTGNNVHQMNLILDSWGVRKGETITGRIFNGF